MSVGPTPAYRANCPRCSLAAALRAGHELVKEMMKKAFVCGNNADAHLAQIEEYAKAGFDEIYVANTGPNHQASSTSNQRGVLPAALTFAGGMRGAVCSSCRRGRRGSMSYRDRRQHHRSPSVSGTIRTGTCGFR
jgi:hypothetical protein